MKNITKYIEKDRRIKLKDKSFNIKIELKKIVKIPSGDRDVKNAYTCDIYFMGKLVIKDKAFFRVTDLDELREEVILEIERRLKKR